jgi:hypothetical protein
VVYTGHSFCGFWAGAALPGTQRLGLLGWWDRVASRSQFHEGTVIRMFLEPEGCEYQLTIRTPEGIVTEGHEPFC